MPISNIKSDASKRRIPKPIFLSILREYGQPMSVDAKRKFDAGLIAEREYKRLIMTEERASQDV